MSYCSGRMTNKIKHIFTDAKAATAIEFALVFPVVILFFFITLEYSLMSFGNSVMENVVSMIARQSAMGCYDAEYVAGNSNLCSSSFFANSTALEQDIIRKSAGLVRADDHSRFSFTAGPIATYTSGLDMGEGGDLRVIRIAYRWPVFFSYLTGLGLIGSTANFEAVTIVRNERFGNLGAR